MNKIEKFYLKYCKFTGKFLKDKASDELKTSLKFLKWKIDPDFIVGAARFTMFLGFILTVMAITLAFFLGDNVLPYVFILPFSIVLFYLTTEWPKTLSQQRALKSLGFSPHVIAQISIPLKQKPNLESALALVSKYGEGEIVSDIREMLWDIWATKKKNIYDALNKIAEKWGYYSRGFQRSIHLILASFHESNKKMKLQHLDKTLDVILEDITSRLKRYASSLSMPTLILFSIGIILPLMVISIFPIVSFFGLSIDWKAITGFLAFSLIASFTYSFVILRKRPITFSMHEVKSDVPEGFIKMGGLIPAKHLAILVAILVSTPGIFFLMGEFGATIREPFNTILKSIGAHTIVWGFGLGLSIYFYSKSAYKKKRRDYIRKIESEFTDFLYHLKNKLHDGRPIEVAIEFSTNLLKNMKIHGLLSNILNKMKRRSMNLDQIIEEENIDSNIIKSNLKLISRSLKDGGKAASQTTSVIHDYLSKINSVEKDINNALSKSIGMMKATAIFFAPVVCAIIVVLFQLVTNTVVSAKNSFTYGYGIGGVVFSEPSISPEFLHLIMGIYVLLLSYVLIGYVSKIQYGPDKINLYHNLSRSIPLTLIIFTATLLFTQVSLLGMGLI